MAETRKLAAILAADVVGYGRLAASDEERTLARLRALRSDLIDPTIALHHGRVVKRTGDGVLIEFRSVVDAVRCAIEVQNGMAERNAGLPPDRRIEFRIDVILGKALSVLPETELLKPVRNLLHRGPSPRGYRAELLDRAMESLTDKSQGSTPPLD
jgi:class 3 adenylate cyclase